jgi:ribonucleoside-diphosphate reductase alpha chain
MRALWSAGPVADRDHVSIYNCAFLPIDNLRAFAEALYILMQGTGVGFSVESEFTEALPIIAPRNNETRSVCVDDSAEGWAEALYTVIVYAYQGYSIDVDYSLIRPKNTPLKTKGGRSSGPEPLRKMMNFAQDLISKASQRQLSTLECHDLMCMIAEVVIVGGFRRAAMISFSDPQDQELRHAKNWRKGSFPSIRYMANNSAFYHTKPSKEAFWQEWTALKESGSGERGFSMNHWHRYSDRPQNQIRSNPCHEIGLRYRKAHDPWTGEGGAGQFCNLSAVVLRAHDTPASFQEKVEVATWLGCIQASFTHFPFLRSGWADLCNEDRLIGVDITGQCDHPTLSQDAHLMKAMNQVALKTAKHASDHLGINIPAAITCGKPSGNTSQLVDCASGFHQRHSHYYLRHVRISAADPLFRLIQEQGVPLFKENGQEDLPDHDVTTWVAQFPIKSPDDALTRDDETALEQCQRYLNIMQTWCSERGHNQSATIYVRDHEWQEVGQWVWDHFDKIIGLSFLPYDGGEYRLAPYVEIDKETYLEAVDQMPTVDFARLALYEQEDRGHGAQILACSAGGCDL